MARHVLVPAVTIQVARGKSAGTGYDPKPRASHTTHESRGQESISVLFKDSDNVQE